MKTRVLELLKEPKNIQKEDLQILKDQINEFPYLQNVRALHLYGVHLYEPENYQKDLSKTAAYTTDKKNLYHLINGKLETKKVEIASPKTSPITETKKPYPAYVPKNGGFPLRRPEEKQETVAEESPYTAVQPLPEVSNQPVEVKGQRNRILFEGEENFLNEENTVKIDLESSMESGNLVTEKLTAPSETRNQPVGISTENQAQNRIEDVNSEIQETESEHSSEKIEAVADESDLKNQLIPALESEKDEVEEEKINFDQSEIKVSPDHNLEEAVEAIVEDQAISFQEVTPLETEIKEEVKKEEVFSKDEVQNQTDFSSETIISEDKIESEDEKQNVEDDSQLSFHGTESFLPEIKIESKSPTQQEIPAQNSPSKNKYEDEMRRLIEQVELKMKEAKKESVNKEKVAEKEEEPVTSEISFAETQSFEVETQSLEAVENVEDTTVEDDDNLANDLEISYQTEDDSQSPNTETEAEITPSTSWKPMSFETNTLDYSIGKKVEAVEQKPAEKPESVIEEPIAETAVAEETDTEEENKAQEETTETSKEEEKSTPAFNVSFFGNNISSFIKSNQKEESNQKSEEIVKPEAASQPKTKPDQREIPSILDSNVPGFINTWQNWLKIDRLVEVEKEKVEIKEKAIEAFIENNPKISQLKDESSFVIKERNDDISHLMTETLAKLYTEQKLYSKATQAYQILIGKHPEKKLYFEEKIQEIKDIRGR